MCVICAGASDIRDANPFSEVIGVPPDNFNGRTQIFVVDMGVLKLGVPYFGVLIIGSYYLGYYIRVPYFRNCHLDVDVCTDVGMDGCK